ncbi:MAG: PASTA domain-containing protein [Oscillospiraceae bacterium]|nr:PASTA domain-containing protein [Oscillospiraceae bacterium]
MNANDIVGRCPSCMRFLEDALLSPEGEPLCPGCENPLHIQQPAPYLPLNSLIGQGRYGIGRVVSHNGDGATYLGFDARTQKPVFLREFLPDAIALRQEGQPELFIMQGCETVWRDCAQNFLELWRKLQRLRGLSALIAVTDVFEDCNTIYAVYEHMEWMTLREFLLRGKTGAISWERARTLLMPVLSTLGNLHSQGILHRGISPNTLMFGADGKVRIGGFSIWQARTAHGDLTAELLDGYAALEQYGLEGKQGAWTDIYAFAAVLYRALIGSDPDDAVTRRHNDRVMVPAQVAERIPAYVINALINAMQIFPEDRTRTVEQLRAELSASPVAAAQSRPLGAAPAPEPRRVVTEPFQKMEQAPASPKKKKKKESSVGVAMKTTGIILGVGLLILSVVIGVFFREKFIDVVRGFQKESVTAATSFAERSNLSIEVPEFVGQTYDDALREQYRSFDLAVEYRSDETIAEGEIISQSVEKGEQLPAGSTITLVVSKGLPPVELPKIEGKNIKEVRKTLEGLGFVVKTNEMANSGGEAPGEVISSVPPGETEQPKGREIYITFWGNPDGSPVEAAAEETTAAAE